MPVCPPVSFGPGGFFIVFYGGFNVEEKEFKNSEELVEKLRSRGMNIKKGKQSAKIANILEYENYYRIINGYKDLFLSVTATATTEEQYKIGTTFDEVYALYNFDRKIRSIYLQYLLKVENVLKSVISHTFSELYGHNNYLKLENFQSTASTNNKILRSIAKSHHLDYQSQLSEIKRISAKNNTGEIIKLIGEIQQELARQMSKGHQAVVHYMTQHGYIPLWVSITVLTFGKVAVFFKLMKDADKITVAKKFGVQADELHKFMEMLGIARNKCAHDERFFDIKFRQSLKTNDIKNFSQLHLAMDSNNHYAHGTDDAYAIAIIFALLLGKNDTVEFISAMKSEFNKLSKRLHTIKINDVMEIMGFNNDWANLSNLY